TLRRRSCVALGRIEMRSSSWASQLIAFIARSLFAFKPLKLLARKPEFPTTTKRPCEFDLPVEYSPDAARTKGPFLFFGSPSVTDAELRFDVASARSPVENSFSVVLLLLLAMFMDCASGNAVAECNSLTIACVP